MKILSRRFVVLVAMSAASFLANALRAETPSTASAKSVEVYPPGWETMAPRDEIRPQFSFDSKGGPEGRPAFVIATSDSVATSRATGRSRPSSIMRAIRSRKPKSGAMSRLPRSIWTNVISGETILATSMRWPSGIGHRLSKDCRPSGHLTQIRKLRSSFRYADEQQSLISLSENVNSPTIRRPTRC